MFQNFLKSKIVVTSETKDGSYLNVTRFNIGAIFPRKIYDDVEEAKEVPSSLPSPLVP